MVIGECGRCDLTAEARLDYSGLFIELWLRLTLTSRPAYDQL